MTVSTFDPFRSVTDPELRDWLRHRNDRPTDEAVIDYVVPLSSMVEPTISVLWRLRGLARLIPSWRMTRAHRSRDGRIGLHECDMFIILERILLWPALGTRLAATALTVAMGALMALPGLIVSAFGVAAWITTGWRWRFALPLLAAASVPVILQGTSSVVLWALLLYLFLQVRISVPMFTTRLLSRKVLTSPVRFLGRGFMFRALWDRTASSVMLAVDKATHDDRARAGLFVDDVLDGGRHSPPAHLRPVLMQCQAMAALGRLAFQEAMTLSEQARTLAVGAPAEIRGWCALQSGDVLLEAGQPRAAQVRWQEAFELLDGRPRARYWAIQADLRMIEALTADLAETERCLDGLRRLYRVRVNAVRDADAPLLDKTEMYLLRLMNEAGNAVEVVEHLLRQGELDEGRVPQGDRIADYAARSLLLATLYLDILENPARYPDAMQVDEADRRTRYHHAATLIDQVLRHLSRAAEPVLQAHAFAILARVQAATELPADALGNALESLNIVQRVRYQLPTSAWRAKWVAAHAHTYMLALNLATGHSPALVAELLETVRAQAVPVEPGAAGTLLRSVLDSLVTATRLPAAVAADDGDAASSRSDPLLTDATILVSGASWVGGDPSTAIDLDHELTAMAPGGWYWSLARVGDLIHHAVRSPQGEWTAHCQPYGPFAELFTELLRHLPIELLGTAPAKTRLTGTAFVAEHADDRVDAGAAAAGEVWHRILDNLGAALIPPVLVDALTAGDVPVPLVVAPTASLTVVPIWALRIDSSRRVADVAAVSHTPSIALLAHRRRLASSEEPGSRPNSNRVLAVLAPHEAPEDPWFQDLPHAASTTPPRAEIVTGPMRKTDLAALLRRRRAYDGVLLMAGHVDPPPDREPGGAGFRFAGQERFGLRDFYRTDPDGNALYPMPRRVVLAGCASLGVYSKNEPLCSLEDSPEWLGLGAAVVYGGAHHVLCTLFPVLDTPHTQRIDLALVEAMRHNIEPAWALRATQLAELRRWENGEGAIPAVFLAYAYVGLGAALTHGPNVVPFIRAPERLVTEEEEVIEESPARPVQSLDAILPPARTFHPQFRMLGRHTHDQRGLDDRLSPNVLPDGTVEFSHLDGEVTGPIAVTGASWEIDTINPERLSLHTTTEWRVTRLSLFVTDARLVLVADRPLKDGRRFAGHLRYPWISSTGFRPKQSFLNECELIVTTQQDITEDLTHFNRLVVRFGENTDSGQLAQDLVRRLARYHLSNGVLPDTAAARFTAFCEAERLPDPDKGDHSVYYLPAFKPYPYGVEHTSEPLENEWLGPAVRTSD